MRFINDFSINAKAGVRRGSVKMLFLTISHNSQESTCVESLIKKVSSCKLIENKPPTHVFFCEFCQNFKNTYFEKLQEMAINTGARLNQRKQFFKVFKTIFPYCAKRSSCITSGLLLKSRHSILAQ